MRKMDKRVLALTAAMALSGYGAFAQNSGESTDQGAHKMDHSNMGDHKMGDHEMGAMHGSHQMMGDHMGKSGDGAYHHRFDDAEKWAKQFDKPERDAWQKPDQVIESLKLPKNAVVADVGAGTGYFSARIAKKVPEGKVYSVDIEQDMVRYLGERAKKEGLSNLTPVQGSATSPNLPEPVDLIMYVDAYHHVGNREEYYGKLKSSLKPDGHLVIIDFRADTPDGPPKEHRVAFEKSSEELKNAGYTLVETFDFLPRQYFAVFKKSSN